jgi:CMP-N-acetylneuraminic acid synthetase
MAANKHPLVTVYITNFNYGRYLERAIRSVLDQTFQDFELIIIDDGSTDGSHKILETYETRERTFVIFQQNKGLNATNNIALKLARGTYIMRLDADDYLDPHALEIMVSTLERKPELALVFPDYYLVDEQGNVIEQVRRHDFEKDVSLLDQPAHGACTLIRRDVLQAVGGYDETFNRQDGYDLWLKIIDDYPIQNVNLPLFYYRQHAKSLTRDETQLLKTRSEIKAKHVRKRGLESLSVLTVVPVRGSVADPRSLPLAPLGDKCLIDWTLQAALASEHVSDVLVTTPDYQVQNYVRQRYGSQVSVVERTPELARINTRIEETILDTLDFYVQDHASPDVILVLYVEAPFRSTMYIDKAIHTMQLYDVDVVDGVRLDDSLFYVHNGQGLRPWQAEGGLRLERGDLYRRVGGLHLIHRDFLETKRKMIGGKIGHILMDQKAALLIRSELDWQIASFLAEQGG